MISNNCTIFVSVNQGVNYTIHIIGKILQSFLKSFLLTVDLFTLSINIYQIIQ